jgi:hypothetical protein
MPERSALRYLDWVRQSSGFALIGLVVAWTLFDKIFDPIFLFALHVLYAGVHSG